MPIETVDVARATLRIRTGGAGDSPRTVVMALDPPNVLEHYAQPFIAWQRASARLVAFEPPGFGQSTAPRGYRHGLDEAASIVVALLERLASPKPAVLAFPCLSAYVALRVAHERPDLVGGLVLMQAPSWSEERAWADRVDRRGVLRTPGLGQLALLFRSDPIVRSWYKAAVADPERGAHLAAIANETLDHGARFPLASAFQAAFRGDAAPPPRLQADIPALHVWGRRDRSHRASDPASVREHAPHAEVVTMEDVGHFPELEAPVAFRDVVVEWMRRQGL